MFAKKNRVPGRITNDWLAERGAVEDGTRVVAGEYPIVDFESLARLQRSGADMVRCLASLLKLTERGRLIGHMVEQQKPLLHRFVDMPLNDSFLTDAARAELHWQITNYDLEAAAELLGRNRVPLREYAEKADDNLRLFRMSGNPYDRKRGFPGVATVAEVAANVRQLAVYTSDESTARALEFEQLREAADILRVPGPKTVAHVV
jgi:hypothetical protein